MVFFQAMLLAGYAYAHILVRFRWHLQALIHTGVLALAIASVPFADPQTLIAHTDTWPPIPQLLITLAYTIGLPFFAVSSTSPLLQVWFAGTNHRDAEDPYFLYGASNVGSLAALLTFPAILERAFDLSDQNTYWATGFVTFAALMATSFALARRNRVLSSTRTETRASQIRITWRDRIRWIIYALVPSAMLNSVTLKISTDIAAAPLLWIVPLALYLTTFIIVFSRRPVIPHTLVLLMAPFAGMLLVLVPWISESVLGLLLHFPAFFVLVLMCHGELVKLRPQYSKLTDFYLAMSIGGVLGGILTAIVAPILFDSVYEYPLSIMAALALMAQPSGSRFSSWKIDIAIALAIVAGPAIFASGVLDSFADSEHTSIKLFHLAWMIAVLAITFPFRKRPLRYGLIIGTCLLSITHFETLGNILHSTRSFFGVYRVFDMNEEIVLKHGTTVHGGQSQKNGLKDRGLFYYHNAGAYVDAMTAGRAGKQAANIRIVGLGTGALACIAKPNDTLDFIEIDPAIEAIARNRRYFSYLDICDGNTTVTIGDGRKKLEQQANGSLDILSIDAFSSDAIPVHLVTKEAIEMYISKLKPDGVLVLHIANRYLDLKPVLARIAAEQNLAGLISVKDKSDSIGYVDGILYVPTKIVILSHPGVDLETLPLKRKWEPLGKPNESVNLWTDNRSSIVETLRWF